MSRRITVFVLFVSFVVFGALTPYSVAQHHAGDCVGVGEDGQLYQVDPLGRVTTHKIGSGALHGWTMDYDNRNMLVTDRDARCLYLVAEDFTVTRVFPLPATLPLDVAIDQNADIFFTDGVTRGLMRFAFRGGVEWVALDLASDLGGGLVQDVDTSEMFVFPSGGSLDASPIYRVRREGGGVTTLPAGVTASYGTTQTPDGAFWVASVASAQDTPRVLYRFMPGAGAAVPVGMPASGATITGATAVKADRSSAPTQQLLVAAYGGQGLWRLDVDQQVVSRVSPLAATLHEVGFRGERNLGSARVGPRQWSVNVTFPGEGGGIYLVALGHSGVRPPIRLPDGRRLWLVPDALTLATVAGPLPPFVMGNLGTLDASGRAFVTLDLTTLPVNANGVLVWLVAATLDPTAPSGLRTITDPMVFRIE